ncbi:MAG: filamentous hemagglutinin N-terminal domain-containing protein, partial [Candidatus Omnitrophota bacterium]
MRYKGRYIKMDKAVVVIVSALLALTNCHTAAFAGDLPAGAVVQAGNASITSDGTNMTVVTDAAKTWIDWTGGFNIGAANSVNNIAAETSAVILHRDITGALSNIQGALTANCNVFLLNPSGILFGSGAQINVAGLLVSTLNMSIQDFINGDYLLEQGVADAGLITNLGEINATGPTGVTLAGGAVRNEGVINAGLGTVNLVSGSKVTLNADSEGLIQVAVDGQVLENVYDKNGNKVEFGVDNVGEINANGGKVYIETEAAQNVFSKLINQSGVVKAGSMVNKGGKIVLVSNSEGVVENSGTMNVSGVEDGASGGTIEIRGEKVGQFGSVKADGLGAGDGGNVELRAAKTVALGPHSATTANAGVNGNGGRVVVFSPDSALMAPTAQIAVRGGDNSGNGGFVEFSGQKYVEVNGIIDRRAPNGKAGLLLIDPTDITINDAGADDTLWTADAWADDSSRATSQIDIDTLITHLLAGDTTITTLSGGVGSGDITLNAPGRILTNTTAHSLTLTAERNITFSTAVNFEGSGSLNLNASGAVAVNNSVALNGGAFDSNGTSFTSGALGTITTNGGAVDLSGHSAGITIGAAINTGGGSFISAGTAFDNTGGTITTAGGDITINQTGAVIIGAALDSGTGDVNIDAGDTLTINKPIISTTGNISIDSTNAATIAADGDIQTNSGTVTFGADKTGALTTSADIIAGGSITFTRGVTLGAASVITSVNDSVTFSGDVSGAFSLTVNAADAVFSSTIGSNDDPTSLIITANSTRFGGAVSVGSLTVNGSGGTTTISADITSAGKVEINDNVVISGVRTISTAAANANIYISGTVNASAANTDALTLAAGTGNVTLGNSVGDSVQLEDLTITSSGITTLNHTIDVNGSDSGEDINLSGASNVVLGSDVTLDSARSVYLNAINGQGHNLTVRAGYTIDLNAAISNVLNVSMTAVAGMILLDHAVTATQDATFTTINPGMDIVVQAALTAGRSLTLTANTASTSSDIEIGTGSDLEAPVVTLRSCIIIINQAVDNSIGSLHLIAEDTSGGMVLRNSITAHGDLTIDGSIWVNSDGVGLTSTDGDIRLNCTVDSNDATSRDLSLTAGQGTVYAGTFGGTFRLEDISVSAQQLVLGGNIAAETVNTSSVGLTTLANAIDIDTTVGAGSITLGPLTGANNLTISSGGAVTLGNADIASLDIDAATTVSFNGDFKTSGGVTVDTAISDDITVSGSIQAGGNVTLDNTAGAGTADIVLNGNVSTTGSSTITISADDAVNIAQSAAASVSAVNGEIDITSAGAIALGTGTYVGKITTTGAGAIDINNTGALTMGTASGTEISGGGDVDIAGAAGITNTIASTTSGDVALHGAVTLAANAVVSSANGNVTFYNTVNATSDNTETLTANALNGIVTFQNTIGDTTDPGALTVNASAAVFYNTVLAGGNIDINANAVTLDTV